LTSASRGYERFDCPEVETRIEAATWQNRTGVLILVHQPAFQH
jgi:hypothetical protein